MSKSQTNKHTVRTRRYVEGTNYIYIKSTTVYVPSSELGLSHPTPFSPASVPLPKEPGGGGAVFFLRGTLAGEKGVGRVPMGAHSAASEGLGESQFLCLLWDGRCYWPQTMDLIELLNTETRAPSCIILWVSAGQLIFFCSISFSTFRDVVSVS